MVKNGAFFGKDRAARDDRRVAEHVLVAGVRRRPKCRTPLRSKPPFLLARKRSMRHGLDSLVHSEMTGGKASMSDEIDAEVSAWDGYITGRNLKFVPGERIVQSWRTTQFTDEREDSIITVTLEEVEGGTLLTLALHDVLPCSQLPRSLMQLIIDLVAGARQQGFLVRVLP